MTEYSVGRDGQKLLSHSWRHGPLQYNFATSPSTGGVLLTLLLNLAFWLVLIPSLLQKQYVTLSLSFRSLEAFAHNFAFLFPSDCHVRKLGSASLMTDYLVMVNNPFNMLLNLFNLFCWGFLHQCFCIVFISDRGYQARLGLCLWCLIGQGKSFCQVLSHCIRRLVSHG